MKLNYLMQTSIITFALISSSLFCLAVRPKLIQENGAYRIERYIPVVDARGIEMKRFTTQSANARVIDTRGNNVGIAAGDVCAYAMFPNIETFSVSTASSGTDLVVCKSGKVFQNVSTIVGSRTGTPPHLQYKNYIGQSSLIGEESKRYGAGKRIIYLAQQ